MEDRCRFNEVEEAFEGCKIYFLQNISIETGTLSPKYCVVLRTGYCKL